MFNVQTFKVQRLSMAGIFGPVLLSETARVIAELAMNGDETALPQMDLYVLS